MPRPGHRIMLTALLVGTSVGSTADTARPLTDISADTATGRQIFIDRDAGHCVLCHRIAGLDAPFQGDLGPDLSGVGKRLDAAQIRYRIIDASRLNPRTVMPPYHRTEGLHQVATEHTGRTLLTARQIEHLVAYLATLMGRTP